MARLGMTAVNPLALGVTARGWSSGKSGVRNAQLEDDGSFTIPGGVPEGGCSVTVIVAVAVVAVVHWKLAKPLPSVVVTAVPPVAPAGSTQEAGTGDTAAVMPHPLPGMLSSGPGSGV